MSRRAPRRAPGARRSPSHRQPIRITNSVKLLPKKAKQRQRDQDEGQGRLEVDQHHDDFLDPAAEMRGDEADRVPTTAPITVPASATTADICRARPAGRAGRGRAVGAEQVGARAAQEGAAASARASRLLAVGRAIGREDSADERGSAATAGQDARRPCEDVGGSAHRPRLSTRVRMRGSSSA